MGIVLSEKKYLYLFLFFVVCLGISCFSAFPPYSNDDSYITYRYAYNLYHHREFAFNLGEKILGTTTPLYTLILTGLQVLSDNIPLMSNFISFLSASLAGFLIFLIMRKDNLPLAIFSALCFPFMLLGSIGLETNFLIFLFALSMYLFSRERYFICSIALGLCFLTRQDSAAFILCMIIIYWLKNRKVPWKEFIVFIIIIAPWFTFSYFYFDSLFPSSLHAKKGSVSFIHYLVNALWTLAQYCDRYNFFLFSFLSRKATHLLSPSDVYSKYVAAASLITLYMPIIMFGILYYVRNNNMYNYTGILFYLYPLMMIMVLSFIAPPPAHGWHLAGAITFALIGQLNILTTALLSVGKHARLSARWGSLFPVCITITISAYLIFFIGLNIKDFYAHATYVDRAYWVGARFHNYQKIGLFLLENVSEGERVFSLEVGTIGYYSNKKMVDGSGLISPGYEIYNKRGCWLMGIEKGFPDYIVTEDNSIPYYEPIFHSRNSFGNYAVYKKLKNLPEDSYPFAELERNCNEAEENVTSKIGRDTRRKHGALYTTIETIMKFLLDKYLTR